jgi:hypothetical protein
MAAAWTIGYLSPMPIPRDPIDAGYRHPAELISYAVWLYFRFLHRQRHRQLVVDARAAGAMG